MKNNRIKTGAGILLFLFIIGMLSYFFYSLNQRQQVERIDLDQIAISESSEIISINQPNAFISMLEHQPQLNSFFQRIIPEDYFRLLKHIKHAPVLISYFPQGNLLYYPIYNAQDNIRTCFGEEQSIQVNDENICFRFYPRKSGSYFGYCKYKEIIIAGYSLNLLKKAVKELQKKPIYRSEKKDLKTLNDKNSLMQIHLFSNTPPLEQTLDVFLHEKQVCCLLQKPLEGISDSIIALNADSLSIEIQNKISNIKIDTNYSIDESFVYYTFCCPLYFNR